jgi:glycosyltransferase involved in cell wall biosynthesis
VENEIAQTINSLLAQDYSRCEIVVVDGESTDDTLKIIRRLSEKHPDQVRYHSGPDDGIYEAMNRGIDLARGDYLLFLGAGDKLAEGIFAELEPELEFESEFIYGNRYNNINDYLERGKFDRYRLCWNTIPHSAQLTHRSVFEKIGKFNPKYHIAADYDFVFRCFGKNNINIRYLKKKISSIPDLTGYAAQHRDRVFFEDKEKIIANHLGEKYVKFYRDCGRKFNDLLKNSSACNIFLLGKAELISRCKNKISEFNQHLGAEINITGAYSESTPDYTIPGKIQDKMNRSEYLILATYYPEMRYNPPDLAIKPEEIIPSPPLTYTHEFLTIFKAVPADVVIFGAGQAGDYTQKAIEEFNSQNLKHVNIQCFFDNQLAGKKKGGLEIKKPSKTLVKKADWILLASEWAPEMKQQLVELGVTPSKIIQVSYSSQVSGG